VTSLAGVVPTDHGDDGTWGAKILAALALLATDLTTAQAAITALQGLVSLNTQLISWTNGQSWTWVSATYNGNGAITTASVLWPDGGSGTYTADTLNGTFLGATDAFHVTYSNGAVSKTVTQTAVTRDGSGRVTAQPTPDGGLMRTLDVPGVTLAVGNATWAALGTVFKTGIVYKGDQVASGYDMIPNGVYVPSTCTMTAVKITLDFPTIGGTQAWNIVLDHAGTKSTVATVTIADGARGAVTNSLSVSLVAGDLLLFQCSAANGVTFTGAGPTVQFAIGGSLSIPTAPGANGNPVATPTPTSIGLTWTAATGAFNYLIRRDGKPYAITALLAYTDLGPTGAGLSAGESHSYNVDALVPGAITVNTNSVSAAASASYSYFPAVSQNVGALTNDFVVTAGSNTTGASAAHTDATGLETLTSGATGANNVQDTVHVDWVKESSTQSQSDATNRHQAIRMYTEFGFGTAAAVMNHFFNEQAYPGVSPRR
jgi:YD repeat-containing protein